MVFELRRCPFDKNALEPYISAETLEYHYGKHHQTYVTTLNKADRGQAEANKTLEEIITSADGPLFNNGRPGLEPHLLLERPERKTAGRPKGPCWRRSTAPSPRTKNSSRSSRMPSDPVRLGLGLAGCWRRGRSRWSRRPTPTADETRPDGALEMDVWETPTTSNYRNRGLNTSRRRPHLINWNFVAKNMAGANKPVCGS